MMVVAKAARWVAAWVVVMDAMWVDGMVAS